MGAYSGPGQLTLRVYVDDIFLQWIDMAVDSRIGVARFVNSLLIFLPNELLLIRNKKECGYLASSRAVFLAIAQQ